MHIFILEEGNEVMCWNQKLAKGGWQLDWKLDGRCSLEPAEVAEMFFRIYKFILAEQKCNC